MMDKSALANRTSLCLRTKARA